MQKTISKHYQDHKMVSGCWAHLSESGDWIVYMYMQRETVPKETNRVYLSKNKKDPWGIPQLVTDISYDENDEKMIFIRKPRK